MLTQSIIRSFVVATMFTITACGGGVDGGSENQPPTSGNQPPTSENQPPSAVFTSNPLSGDVPLEVIFDAGASSDSDGSLTSYVWSFGDGQTGSGITVAHSYTEPGSYAVVLTVTDDNGATDMATGTVTAELCDACPLSGRITADSNITVDGDLNDPSTPYTSNDDSSSAQMLPNPVMLNGFVSSAGTLNVGDRFEQSGDLSDVFQVTLYAGQYVSLRVTDYDAINQSLFDVDLYLLDSNLNLVASSESTNEYESIAVPTDGTYYVVANAFSGINKYVLNIGSVSLTTGTSAYGQTADFVPGQAIIKKAFRPIQQNQVQPLNRLGTFQMTHEQSNRAALLKMQPNTKMSQAIQLLGGKTIANESNRSWQSKLPSETKRKLDTLRLIKQLNARPDLEYAEPNFIVKPTLVPDDSFYGFQEHYSQIRLPQAWDVTTGTPQSGNVVVAVVDTGVFLQHEDLAGQLVSGYDFISDPTMSNDGDGIDADPDDPGDNTAPGQSSWHGTHVAGTVAAASNNSVGVAGVSWGAKIMPIRVLGIGGGTDYDIAQGVLYAAGLPNDSGTVPTKAADIINLSLGGYGASQTSQDVYTSAYNAGVIVIAAAGNDNISEPSYPASYDGVTSVSAIDYRNDKAPYSNYGSTIDVGAPGGNKSVDENGDGYPDGVLSCIVDDASGARVPVYWFYEGTSMASPHIAGVAALMKAVYPGLTPSEFDFLLINGQLTNDLGDPGRDDIYGYGMIDALQAVEAAQQLAGGTLPNTVVASPTLVDFDSTLNVSSVTLSGFGGNPPTVTGFNDNVAWLTVTAGTVDGNGLGDYTLSVDRTGLVDATYSGTVTFTLSGGNSLEVVVTMRVQTVGTQPGTAGYLYIVLFDSDLNNQAQLEMSATDGVYDYRFDSVPPGEYYVIAGSDVDNNGYICEPGESCGAYPLLSQKTLIAISQEVNDVDFSASINSGLGTQTTSLGLGDTKGFPVMKRQTKIKEVPGL